MRKEEKKKNMDPLEIKVWCRVARFSSWLVVVVVDAVVVNVVVVNAVVVNAVVVDAVVVNVVVVNAVVVSVVVAVNTSMRRVSAHGVAVNRPTSLTTCRLRSGWRARNATCGRCCPVCTRCCGRGPSGPPSPLPMYVARSCHLSIMSELGLVVNTGIFVYFVHYCWR